MGSWISQVDLIILIIRIHDGMPGLEEDLNCKEIGIPLRLVG